MLREGPGKFAGKAYDEKKVKQALDQLPDDLSDEEAYKHLLTLFAEDYRPVLKEMDRFNTGLELSGDTPGGIKGPDGQKSAEEKPLYVSILLDASGSMAGQVDGGMKMNLAKAAVERFASSLPENAKVSLWVYGHKGSNSKKDKQVSCKSTEEVYPLGNYQEKKFSQSLDQFQATGWTPIAASMKAAREELQKNSGEDATHMLYIVSDGVETCGGDPVAEAKKLNQSQIKAVVNIIGFDVDDAGQQALQKVAEAGGGEYETVESEQDLRSYFDEQYLDLRLEWMDWGHDQNLDVASQFYDKIDQLDGISGTGGGMYSLIEQEWDRMTDAIEYLDNKGKFQNNARSSVWDLVTTRENKLSEYRKTRHNEIRSSLENNKETMEEKIEEKATGMQEKYK
ncbi:VWA domain-containing protein [Kroppenstedtia eburnea]|uniref:VWA domain-containing protein n=1 Tax=Kroppenstedtia eburnea TaxID=714067 RepID=UPI00362C68D6